MARLVLVGLPGAGKSSVGRAVAERVGVTFVDTDELVAPGRSTADVFRELGEPAFRERELACLETALAQDVVVATGGGVVSTAAGRAILSRERCVWLRVDPRVLVRRVRHGDRPVLGDEPASALRALAQQREPWYREVARASVDASRPRRIVIDDVVAIVEEWASCE